MEKKGNAIELWLHECKKPVGGQHIGRAISSREIYEEIARVGQGLALLKEISARRKVARESTFASLMRVLLRLMRLAPLNPVLEGQLTKGLTFLAARHPTLVLEDSFKIENISFPGGTAGELIATVVAIRAKQQSRVS